MHNLFHSFASLGLVFITLFSGNAHHTTFHSNNPTPIVQEHRQHDKNGIVTANGTLSRYGQTLTFNFTFPENGGKVSGSIGGACSGNIEGTYSGGKKGDLVGDAHAKCQILFTTFSGTASFHSYINAEGNSVDLPVKVSAEGAHEDLTVPLSLSE